jgi:hypothetical protein
MVLNLRWMSVISIYNKRLSLFIFCGIIIAVILTG